MHFLKNNREAARHQKSSPSFFSPLIQPKLTVNKPNDRFEQEADAMADHVISTIESKQAAGNGNLKTANVESKSLYNKDKISSSAHNGSIQTKTLSNHNGNFSIPGIQAKPKPIIAHSIQRLCDKCEKEEEIQREESGDESGLPVMRFAAGDPPEAPQGFNNRLQQTKGGGSPLTAGTLSAMNESFGTDFSNVRIHDNPTSSSLNHQINAKAFTHGKDIYFNSGQYSPSTSGGNRLIAHELTHVVQQSGAAMRIQRKPSVVAGEPTGFSFLHTSGSKQKDIDWLKKFTPDVTRIWILTGTKLEVINAQGGHLIQQFTVKDTVILPPWYLKLEWDGFYIAAADLDDKLTWMGKTKTGLDDTQKKKLAEIDALFTIDNWFVSVSEKDKFLELMKGQVVSMGVTNLEAAAASKGGGGGEGESSKPPKPEWMKVFEKEFKILIAKKKAAQPASEDLPDVFYFYYSTSKLDWRAYAAQNDVEGKPVTKAYLVVPEKADQEKIMEEVRTRIRIAKLKAPASKSEVTGEPLKSEFLWAQELKIKIEKLVAEKRVAFPTSYDLPDKLSLVYGNQEGAIHLQVSVYIKQPNLLGNEETVLKSGALPEPLRKEMDPAALFELVRRATLALKGTHIQPRGKIVRSDQILTAFPSRIEAINIREDNQAVTNGQNDFKMVLDMASVEGTNTLHLVSLNMRGIYFTWDIYKANDQLTEEERNKLSTNWPDRRKQLVSYFKQSGQLKTNPFIHAANLQFANSFRKQYNLPLIDPTKPFTGEELHQLRRAEIIYGQTTQLTPEAELKMPDVEGDYLIYCRAAMEPMEGTARLPSEAFFPVHVADGYKLAKAETDKPEEERKALEEKKQKEEDPDEKTKIQEQLDKIAKRQSLSLKQRTGKDLTDTQEAIAIVRKLKKLYTIHQNSKSKEIFVLTLFRDKADGEKMLDFWYVIEGQNPGESFITKIDDLISKLEIQQKALSQLKSRVALFDKDIDYKKPTYVPVITFVSEVTGQTYQLISMLGEGFVKDPLEKALNVTRMVLVDVTTSKTQKQYVGYSYKKDKQEAILEATKEAFAEFGRECKYGEGYAYYKVPGLGIEGKVRCKPGIKQRIISILEGVALVAGIAALIIGTVATGGALGVAAVALGLGSAAIGAGLAARNIMERHENHRLEADVELLMDVLNVLGPLLAGLRALSSIAKFNMVAKGGLTTLKGIAALQKILKLEKGVLLLQRVELGTNIVALNYKVVKDLREIEASSLTPGQKKAMQMQIMKHALVSGIMLAVAVRNEIKSTPSATEEMLNKMIAGASKEKYYDMLKLRENMTDADGNWTIPQIKHLEEGETGSQAPKDTPETAGKPSTPETTDKPATPETTGKQVTPESTGKPATPETKSPVPKPKPTPEETTPAVTEKPVVETPTPATTPTGTPVAKPKKKSKTAKATFPEILKPGESFTFPDGAVATRKADGTVVITSVVGPSVGRQGYEKRMMLGVEVGLKKWERAHSQGQGTGHENPFGILFAPREVNQAFQNRGIEKHIRLLFKEIIPPEFTIHLTTETKAHPGTRRLASIEYKIEISKPGTDGRHLLYEASISVANEKVNPKVSIDATPYGITAFISTGRDLTPGARATKKNLEETYPRAKAALEALETKIADLKERAKKGDRGAESLAAMLEPYRKELLKNPSEENIQNVRDSLGDIEANYPTGRISVDTESFLAKNRYKISRGQPEAIKELLQINGNWKRLIQTLLAGTGKVPSLIKNLAFYRKKITSALKKKYSGEELPGASKEPGSDVDINFKGPDAGANLVKAEAEMKAAFGDNWSSILGMNFYTDSRRLTLGSETTVSPKDSAAFQSKVNDLSTQYNLAKMLMHAGEDAQAIARVKQRVNILAPGKLKEIQNLAKQANTQGTTRRDALHAEVDALVKNYDSLPAGDPGRASLAQQITLKQMEINFLTPEAYIGPGAIESVLGQKVTGDKARQAVLSNLELIEHTIAQSGGSVALAAKQYELYKYMFRISEAIGAHQMDLFYDALTKQIYKINREGAKGLTPQQARILFEDFMQYVNRFLAESKAGKTQTATP